MKKQPTKLLQIRQGGVQIQQVTKLPAGCTEIKPESGRLIRHAVYDQESEASTYDTTFDAVLQTVPRESGSGAADEIADAAIARTQAKARLWRSPTGERFLEVTKTMTLCYGEHIQHTLPPGIYHLPRQMELLNVPETEAAQWLADYPVRFVVYALPKDEVAP